MALRTLELNQQQAASFDRLRVELSLATDSQVVDLLLTERALPSAPAIFDKNLWVETEVMPALQDSDEHPELLLSQEQIRSILFQGRRIPCADEDGKRVV